MLITDTCLVSIQVSLLQHAVEQSTQKHTHVISLATLTYSYTRTYIHMHSGTQTPATYTYSGATPSWYVYEKPVDIATAEWRRKPYQPC